MKIPFHKSHITNQEIEAVVSVMKSNWLTMGEKTIEFENNFKEYLGVDYAVSCNSATSALHLALKAIGLKEADEVIIPTNTFIASAEVITYFNAIPVLCDIEADTFNIDINKIEELITKKTKAIMPVHIAGQPCDMDEILSIANKHHLKVIEDSAHTLPATYKNKKIGTIGDITCFSFYPTKTMTTGEGGMATTSNATYAKNMKINRLHGIDRDAWDRYKMGSKASWYYEIVDNGFKYNTTDLASSLGIEQLKKLEQMNSARFKIAEIYSQEFSKQKNIIIPTVKTDRTSAWHLYIIKVSNRDELYEKLKEVGIGTSVHFIPVHMHPYYKNKFRYKETDYPVANINFKKILSLPIFPGMSEEEIQYVVENVCKYAK